MGHGVRCRTQPKSSTLVQRDQLLHCDGFSSNSTNDENSPVEQVALTVPITDDPTFPVITFRMWILGTIACFLLSFLNQFFWYRREPLTITSISAQIAVVPLGHLMAKTITDRVFFKGSKWEFTLNLGPFNVKEHVLITIFANSGAGNPYAIHVVSAVKLFYKKKLSYWVALIVVITTQVLGVWLGWDIPAVFGGAGRHVVAPKSCSSVPIQLGSGLHGLGIGAIALDWSSISSYLGSPLASPWFATANIAVGYFLIMYVVTPLMYWFNVYKAKNFPIFSDGLFKENGQEYNISAIIDPNFHMDLEKYEHEGRLYLSIFLSLTYAFSFACLTATVVHVFLFHGR
ncbi:hypothetical protein RND71_011934 [Anisodus tanguticus]|uniref:Oligopeptide transporter n=1 Tax=Anisodus tanguticus TaxID=243964 RepID=A0AAE1SEF2_9SOLA|nr:hypothetical protein RND71_011934 [Anisodus tanguticus]